MRNVVRYIETGGKFSFLLANPNTTIVLCMVGGERKSANVRVMG